MRKLLVFRLLGNLSEALYIFADKIIAFRKWGEGVRIFTNSGSFDVEDTIEEVLKEVENTI